MLAAHGVTVEFSGLSAISDVSLQLATGRILGLAGPNGAGKTTLVNVLSGFQAPTRGHVSRDGQPLAHEPPDARARAGIVRTFQAVRLFRGLSVRENVEVGLIGAGASRREAGRRAAEVLDRMGLAHRADDLCRALNYGDERRVGIARALALSPRFLLLDEPAAGMNQHEAEELGDLILQIRQDFGCAILLIEHNLALVARVCDQMHVLASGRTIAVGSPSEVLAHPDFRSAYLGEQP